MLMYKIIICSRLQTFFIHYIYLEKYGKLRYFDKNSSKHNDHYIKFDGKDYNKCDEISTISNDELLIEFKNIIEPLYKIDCLHNHIKYGEKDCHKYDRHNHLELNPNPDWRCVKIANIRGDVAANGVKSDFYTLISNNPKEIQKSTRQYGIMSKEKRYMFNQYLFCI